MSGMQINRQNTFYLKNLPSTHPLKRMYKKPYNENRTEEFNRWKSTREKYSDNISTNIHIRFTSKIQ